MRQRLLRLMMHQYTSLLIEQDIWISIKVLLHHRKCLLLLYHPLPSVLHLVYHHSHLCTQPTRLLQLARHLKLLIISIQLHLHCRLLKDPIQ